MRYHSTIGLLATHEKLKGRPRMLRVCFLKQEDEKTVKVWVEDAENCSKLKRFGVVFITREEFAESPDDAYNDAVFACWAFNLFNLKTAFVR